MILRSVLPTLFLIGIAATPLAANPLAPLNAYACGVVNDPLATQVTLNKDMPPVAPNYRPDAASTVKLRILYPAKNGTVEVDHCGGTVIDENWILTAGHCVAAEAGWSHVEVIAGDQHLDGPTTIRRVVTDAVCHAGFRYETLENDVALLRVNTPLPKRITPMGMDSQGHYSVRSGDIAVARGWPVTGSRQGDRMLNQIQMRVQSVDPTSYITAKTVGGASGGLCRGESGGPLVMATPAGRLLTGILSGIQPGTENGYGEECLMPGYEMYFTPVASYRNWIENVRSTCNNNPSACSIGNGGAGYAFASAQPLAQSYPAYEMPATYAAPQQVATYAAPTYPAPAYAAPVYGATGYAAAPVAQQRYYAPQPRYEQYAAATAQQPHLRGYAANTYVDVGTYVTYAPAPRTAPHYPQYETYTVASTPNYATYARVAPVPHYQQQTGQYQSIGNYDSYHARGGLVFLPGSIRTKERLPLAH